MRTSEARGAGSAECAEEPFGGVGGRAPDREAPWPRARRVGLAALVALAAMTAAPRLARAQDATLEPRAEDAPSPVGAEHALGAATGVSYPPEDALIDDRMRRSWDEGEARVFLSSQLDVGWVYLRPRLSAGYGKPFSAWVGLDVNPIVSGDSVGGYAGLRLVLPHLNLRVGPRFAASFNRNYLNPQRNYNRLDLDSTVGDPARLLTWEAELEAALPVGPGDLVGLGSLSYVTNIPKDQLAFEESLRVIVAPPLVWRARGGYLFRFGSARQHSIGVVADVLDVPKRDDSVTVRVGPIVRIVLSRRVEVRGSFVPTVVSPDHIGLVGGDFTELGFRYRWASE